jgi:hypothetical protein
MAVNPHPAGQKRSQAAKIEKLRRGIIPEGQERRYGPPLRVGRIILPNHVGEQ